MNKRQARLAATMVALSGLALYPAVSAAYRQEGMTACVMLVIATVFWCNVQRGP